jgi:hypothetical protein
MRAPARRLRALVNAVDRRALALVAGFSAGTLAWSCYGLWADARGFLDQPLWTRAARAIPENWAAFSEHTGHGLVPVGLLALAVWAFAARAAEPRRTLAGWGLAGGILGTLERGLAPLVAAAVALAWTGFSRRARTGEEPLRALPRPIAWTGAALMTASLLFEIAADLRLLRDFAGW